MSFRVHNINIPKEQQNNICVITTMKREKVNNYRSMEWVAYEQ